VASSDHRAVAKFCAHPLGRSAGPYHLPPQGRRARRFRE
jgi:hypothetical protein